MYTVIDITSNSGECYDYIMELKKIMDLCDSINQATFPFPRVNRFHNEWLTIVEKFIEKWGSDNVPDDLQSSIEEVKAYKPIFATE